MDFGVNIVVFKDLIKVYLYFDVLEFRYVFDEGFFDVIIIIYVYFDYSGMLLYFFCYKFFDGLIYIMFLIRDLMIFF